MHLFSAGEQGLFHGRSRGSKGYLLAYNQKSSIFMSPCLSKSVECSVAWVTYSLFSKQTYLLNTPKFDMRNWSIAIQSLLEPFELHGAASDSRFPFRRPRKECVTSHDLTAHDPPLCIIGSDRQQWAKLCQRGCMHCICRKPFFCYDGMKNKFLALHRHVSIISRCVISWRFIHIPTKAEQKTIFRRPPPRKFLI